MKIFWKVIVAVIAFSLLGIMIVLGTAYIKSVERHTYLADNKVLSDKYVYEEFSNGKKRVKNRATQQVILDRLECPAMWFDRSQWTMESCTSIRLYLYARRRTSDTSKRRSVGGFG